MIASASSGTTSQTTCSMISRESLAMASYSGPLAASADTFWATAFDTACAMGAAAGGAAGGAGAGAGAGGGIGAGAAGRAWTGGEDMAGTPIMVRLVTWRWRPGDCGMATGAGAGAGAALAAGAKGRAGSRGAPGRMPGISEGRRLGAGAGTGAGAGARIGAGAAVGAG